MQLHSLPVGILATANRRSRRLRRRAHRPRNDQRLRTALRRKQRRMRQGIPMARHDKGRLSSEFKATLSGKITETLRPERSMVWRSGDTTDEALADWNITEK